MSKKSTLTENMCEDIFDLTEKKITVDRAAKFVGVSPGSASRVKGVYKALKKDDFDLAVRYCQGNLESPILLWGLKKLNKKLPEKQKYQAQLVIEEPQPDISAPPLETNKTEEALRFKTEETLRLLSNIEKLLQNIALNVVAANKEQNANQDNLYRLLMNTNNSILQEIRNSAKQRRV